MVLACQDMIHSIVSCLIRLVLGDCLDLVLCGVAYMCVGTGTLQEHSRVSLQKVESHIHRIPRGKEGSLTIRVTRNASLFRPKFAHPRSPVSRCSEFFAFSRVTLLFLLTLKKFDSRITPDLLPARIPSLTLTCVSSHFFR